MGRTDTVRSCTSAALAFVKTMVNPAATVSNGMIVSKINVLWVLEHLLLEQIF